MSPIVEESFHPSMTDSVAQNKDVSFEEHHIREDEVKLRVRK